MSRKNKKFKLFYRFLGILRNIEEYGAFLSIPMIGLWDNDKSLGIP